MRFVGIWRWQLRPLKSSGPILAAKRREEGSQTWNVWIQVPNELRVGDALRNFYAHLRCAEGFKIRSRRFTSGYLLSRRFAAKIRGNALGSLGIGKLVN